MSHAVFRKIDCTLLHTPDLAAAIDFYQGRLGQKLIWKSDEAAGFEMPDAEAELVVHTRLGPETDLVVNCVAEAFDQLIAAGASCITPPFDIAIGKCAVLKDPFGNVLTILDRSKGRLKVDEAGNVISREEV
jgi:catechol 2,3-dioxygenase-like lactoylglutathione lyase family enzyme